MNELREIIEKVSKTKINSLVLLDKGITNKNYLCNNSFIFKFKDQTINDFNDINNELVVANYLKDLNLTPSHHFYDTFIIIDYLKGSSHLYDNDVSLFLPSLVESIKQIHRYPNVDLLTNFAMLERLTFYKNNSSSLSIKTEALIINNAKKYYDKAPLCLCHNDLVGGNILIKDNKLFLIDFEYAGLNDPDFDVVSFISENYWLSKKDEELFLKTYYKRVPRKKITVYRRFLDLLWAYWANYCYKKTGREIFKNILEEKLASL